MRKPGRATAQAKRKSNIGNDEKTVSENSNCQIRTVPKKSASYWDSIGLRKRSADGLALENTPIRISTCTIYRGLENGLLDSTLRKKLRIKGRIRFGGHKKSKCGHLDIEYTIHDRPKSVETRKTLGYCEGDTVRGQNGVVANE